MRKFIWCSFVCIGLWGLRMAQAQNDASDDPRQHSQLQANQPWRFFSVPLSSVLSGVTAKTGVTLTCDPFLRDLRFTCRLRQVKAGELLHLLAKTLRLKWFRTEKGFHLSPHDEMQQTAQQQATDSLRAMTMQRQLLANGQRRMQAWEFLGQILAVPPLTDDEVKLLAASYPDVAYHVETKPPLMMGLRIVTHLSSAQLSEVVSEKGLRLTRQQIDAIGGVSQPDAPLSKFNNDSRMADVQNLWIHLQPDGMLKFGYEVPGRVTIAFLDASLPKPFDLSKESTMDHEHDELGRRIPKRR